MPQNVIQSIDSFPNAYGEGIPHPTAATTAFSSAGSIQGSMA